MAAPLRTLRRGAPQHASAGTSSSLFRSYCRMLIWTLLSLLFILQWLYWKSTLVSEEDASRVDKMGLPMPKKTPQNVALLNVTKHSSATTTPPQFHIVFSTGCNAFQDWQSYIFFYQIWKSGQTGHVTRIASGCRDEETIAIQQYFQRQIQLGIPTGEHRFHLHLTPDYSKSVLPGTNFKFFNKPFGLLHWMEQGLNMPQSLPRYADTIFIVLDPDQYVLRPFDTNNFAVTAGDTSVRIWHNRKRNDAPRNGEDLIQEGNPMAQMYLFGSNWWAKVHPNVDRIVKAANTMMQHNSAFPSDAHASSPLYTASAAEVERSYVAGPPYLAVGTDMYRLVAVWAAVAVPVYELTVDHLSEMFAYSVAAVHLSLPHQLSYNFMISHPPIYENEGWAAIDAIPPEQVCDASLRTPQGTIARHLPQVVHFCQRYYLGPYFFSKYRLPWNFLTCEQPLLLDPTEQNHSQSIALLYDSSTTPDGTLYRLPAWERVRQAFILCHIIGTLNDAATFWKRQQCDPNATTVNLEKVYFVPRDPKKKK